MMSTLLVHGKDDGQSLAAYLDEREHSPGVELETVDPDAGDVAGFDALLRRYVAALPVERAAVEHS